MFDQRKPVGLHYIVGDNDLDRKSGKTEGGGKSNSMFVGLGRRCAHTSGFVCSRMTATDHRRCGLVPRIILRRSTPEKVDKKYVRMWQRQL